MALSLLLLSTLLACQNSAEPEVVARLDEGGGGSQDA